MVINVIIYQPLLTARLGRARARCCYPRDSYLSYHNGLVRLIEAQTGGSRYVFPGIFFPWTLLSYHWSISKETWRHAYRITALCHEACLDVWALQVCSPFHTHFSHLQLWYSHNFKLGTWEEWVGKPAIKCQDKFVIAAFRQQQWQWEGEFCGCPARSPWCVWP